MCLNKFFQLRHWMLWITIAWLPADAAIAGDDSASAKTVIEVYKLPTCGCCRTWIKYLEASGFEVVAHDQQDLGPVRLEAGVPKHLEGCHTARVNGYTLEGHVSVEELDQLLNERPAIVGLFVAGMPKGSPGMESPGAESYKVIALEANGNESTFADHVIPDEKSSSPQSP